MNANATPRQSRPPHRLAFARAAGIVLAAMLPRLAAAATLPEPALRLSPALAAPAADAAPEERALLRVEYRAAQTRASEADAVGDILARVRHMNGMIKDIHGLIEALPQTRPATASATATTAQAATPRPAPLPPDDDAAPSADTSLVMRALMASVIVFLFWLLGKRHNYIRTQRRKSAAAEPAPQNGPAIEPVAER